MIQSGGEGDPKTPRDENFFFDDFCRDQLEEDRGSGDMLVVFFWFCLLCRCGLGRSTVGGLVIVRVAGS